MSARAVSADAVPPGLLRAGENCCAVTQAGRVAFLVDGAAYYHAFVLAAERAQRSILILAWDFDSRTPLDFDDRAAPVATLGPFLNQLVHRHSALHVHILDWDFPMIFGHDREFPPLYGLNGRPHDHVHFRFDDTHPLAGSHHQKIVVIDDRVAFVGGLDLTSRRWDTPAHRPGDPRRVAGGTPYPPFHDMMVMVDGDAARALTGIARERWRIATGERLAAGQSNADPWPPSVRPDVTDVQVGIACTAPAVNGHPGAREVEQLYRDMICAARRYIVMEHQYFTSRAIGDALAASLAARDGPEIVLITRLLSHGWLEEVTMQVLRARLIARLRAADRGGRFHVYYPHLDGLAEGTCVDVHSKLMIVDDEWLRIGSSNLSNRSMGVDTECEVVVEASGQRHVSRAIRGFRDRLFAEHLGVAAERFAEQCSRSGSIGGAVTALRATRRTLRELDELPVSDTAVNAAAVADLEEPVSLDRLVDQFGPEPEERPSARRKWVLGIAFVLVIAGLTAAWRLTPLAAHVAPESVIEWAEAIAGTWWAPLAVILAYTPAMVTMFPRPLITLAAVVVFGPLLGFGYAMTGVLLAAMLAYAAVRLVPVAPFVVVSLVAGAIRIRLWAYLAGTFLGMLPSMLAATVFGDQLETALRDPSRINYAVLAAAALAMIVLTLAVRRWLGASQKHR